MLCKQVSGAHGIFRGALLSDVVLRAGQTLGRHPLSACDRLIWWPCPECFDLSDLISALDQKDTCHQDSRRPNGVVRVQKSVCGLRRRDNIIAISSDILREHEPCVAAQEKQEKNI